MDEFDYRAGEPHNFFVAPAQTPVFSQSTPTSVFFKVAPAPVFFWGERHRLLLLQKFAAQTPKVICHNLQAYLKVVEHFCFYPAEVRRRRHPGDKRAPDPPRRHQAAAHAQDGCLREISLFLHLTHGFLVDFFFVKT